MDGASLICHALKEQGVEYMFGVVGIPVIPVGMQAVTCGLKYFGFRNEQAASYAAGAVGYMTRVPGVCLAVSGPGMIHTIAGLSNAWSNCWPMIVIGGANETAQNGMGAFQEAPQVESARPYVKFAYRVDSVERIPFFIEKAVRISTYGRPGPVYLDFPAEVINGVADVALPPRCAPPPAPVAASDDITAALHVLTSAKRPLVIVGKGAAYACAEEHMRKFIDITGLPFLPTPMGKGVVPDTHAQNVNPARTLALLKADVILLVGARLNWILHYGLPPRFQRDVRIVQVDISPEEHGNNVPATVSLVGDAGRIMHQLVCAATHAKWRFPAASDWWSDLSAKVRANKDAVQRLCEDNSVPMTYYRALRAVQDTLPRDAIVVSEGANTMDIGRTLIMNDEPRTRLDAGTFGTMGVGLGFAIAAAAVHPSRKVVAVEGDSAFGFSGLEFEVACRHGLPITIVIINNNGIYQGVEELNPDFIPPTALLPSARYEKIAEAFGGKGYFVTQPSELEPTLKEAFALRVPSIVNVMITTSGSRKKQQFDWLTPSKL